MTVDDKYSLINIDNSKQSIQTQLSQKQNAFCQFLFAFSTSTLKFKNLQKKDDPHSWCILQITDSKKGG